MERVGEIIRIAGPLITAKGIPGVKMYEVCKVGEQELIGEVNRVEGDICYIQVYEETAGIKPGEKVIGTGEPLSVELGPGLIGQIFDGIQRPLPLIKTIAGDFITRGITVPALDRTKKWRFTPTVKKGEKVTGGDQLGTVPETTLVKHIIMVPPNVGGEIVEIASEGEYKIEDPIAKIKTKDGRVTTLTMMQKWPVRKPRPYKSKLPAEVPLITGQRIIDTFFPVAKGGTSGIPGGFGTGKTVTLHQVASWADANIIIYVGCGERGNEMTEVLEKFPTYKDPRTGEPLMNRTVLVANTSNMPVAAREASIYTAITMAEYFRDMGYDVALQADSTSRWAEALRELSGRLEEMPGEEGYPAYLSSRLAEFYERAGRVTTIGSKPRIGSATITGAVSPPGGDFSEPVTQATLRIIKTFWALDSNLSRRRHFPAINWLNSYSLYLETLQKYYEENVSPEWNTLRDKAMALLEEEEKLTEIVQLIGPDALPESERAVLEAARMIREDYLQQSALHPIDTYSPLDKMYRMLKAIITFYEKMRDAVAKGITIREILDLPVVEKIARMKIIPYENKAKMHAEFDQIDKEINEQFLHLELQIRR
ncbi:MAG: V-type ATP synthase subunit A [Candidatus Odinarchaeum yellowstonii]|uniref:A-type ATP synthase subunit A n=1 Tax=Odinarchaeota yellowstonii (strain LCB_4) TaxID=1841599 RepID=A0AAF0IC59_ODILC|nr:MAG: V-type ATP synthase subunit A [Candidatus Odinarchaeum yellowstonii]